MSENKDFGFCPKCGALMQNGTCQSCGYGKIGVQPVRQPKKKSNKLVIGLCIGGGAVLMLALFAAVTFFFVKAVNVGTSVGENILSPLPDEEYYGEEYEYYEPGEDDPYYKEFVDSTRTDLDYQIWWASDSMDPDDYEVDTYYYSTYPVLEPKEGASGNYDAINEVIEKTALQYKRKFREYAGGTNTYSYVTYMDEEQISIAFQHTLYGEEMSMPLLEAVTFEIETGKEIPAGQMFEADRELAMRFRTQDKTQNGGIAYVQELSDEELLDILQDEEQIIAFYTPVGLELGFNYQTKNDEAGWVTVTIKEQTL